MNYEEQVREMLRHATESGDHEDTTAGIGEVVRACGIGVAIVAMGLPNDVIEKFIGEVSKAITAQVLAYKAIQNSDMDSETFLREHFNPGVFHG